ncbi:MAG: molybdopterin-dependent oxidoreductase [Sandaracinaceae bacterium]
MASVHYRTCPLCEAMCGLRIETDGEEVLSIRGDQDDPLSHGYVCPKAPALASIHRDPDRLRRPLRRRGDRWEEVPWATALQEAAEGIHRVQERHGRDAVAAFLGNPTVHNLGASLFAPMLLRALRTKNRFSATSVDQLPHQLVASMMFGHQFLLPIPDLDRTRHLLILGANPLASNGSLMSAPDVKGRLRAIQGRGGKVIVIDPRRTETARVADEHHFIRPGADAWLLAAMARRALVEGRGPGRLQAHTAHLDALELALAPFTAERAAGPTGLAAATIERLARELCAAPSGIVYGRLGTSTQRFGALCNWLINTINVLTGNLDRPGGVLFTTPAVDAVAAPKGFGISPGTRRGRWRSRVRGLAEFGGELPVAALAEEILTEGEGQVRALVTSAGNPVLSTPNGGQLDRALSQLEFMVSIDLYRNETTRHADLILPPTSPLERPHYDVAFHHLAVRNTAKLSDPVFEAPPGSRHDWQIVLDLIEHLEAARGDGGLGRRLGRAALRRLGPVGLVDLGLRLGPYGLRSPFRRGGPVGGLSVRALRRAPHGVDLGPLQPSLPERMLPFRAKIDLAPPDLVADLDRLAASASTGGASTAEAEATGGAALLCVGRRHLRSNNSWMHNAPKLMAGKARCTLLIHPDDAAQRGVVDGGAVEVRSRVGRIEVPAEVTADIAAGVVSLPHGYGHDRPGVELRVARAHAGASLNDLTDDRLVDEVCGTAVLSGFEVHVAPVAATDRAAE